MVFSNAGGFEVSLGVLERLGAALHVRVEDGGREDFVGVLVRVGLRVVLAVLNVVVEVVRA